MVLWCTLLQLNNDYIRTVGSRNRNDKGVHKNRSYGPVLYDYINLLGP